MNLKVENEFPNLKVRPNGFIGYFLDFITKYNKLVATVETLQKEINELKYAKNTDK